MNIRAVPFQTIALFAGFFSVLAAATHAGAQERTLRNPGEDFPAPAALALPEGTVNCFDYYRFGSVQANIAAQTSSAVSGTPITFSGTLVNENSYPIIDGALYVKVFRVRDNAAEKNANGPFVVDQYFVRDGINLPAGGKIPLLFTWDIPSFTPSGEYEVATFFTTSKKYNLLGLSFTDDVVGNRARFSVVGEVSGVVEFDKDAVTVGGRSYRFASFPPRESRSAPIPVRAVVRNGSGKDARVSIRWQVYAWDHGRFENLVDQSEQAVLVPAGKTAFASHAVADANHPVYLVVGTLTWQNTQSIINVRFVREGINRPRINFPAVTSFPLKAGEETTLFSCLHNSGESPSVPGGRLELALFDERGRKIHGYTYEGDITGAMMGVASSFTPKRNYDRFTLEALLYSGNELVDDAQLSYDCSAIDRSACLGSSVGAQDTFSDFLADFIGAAFIVLGGFAILAILYALLRFTRSARQETKVVDNGMRDSNSQRPAPNLTSQNGSGAQSESPGSGQ